MEKRTPLDASWYSTDLQPYENRPKQYSKLDAEVPKEIMLHGTLGVGKTPPGKYIQDLKNCT